MPAAMKHAGAVRKKWSYHVVTIGSRRESATATATSDVLTKKNTPAAPTVACSVTRFESL